MLLLELEYIDGFTPESISTNVALASLNMAYGYLCLFDVPQLRRLFCILMQIPFYIITLIERISF